MDSWTKVHAHLITFAVCLLCFGRAEGQFCNRTDLLFISNGTAATGNRPQSVAPGDLNGDGIVDIAVANEYSNSVSILLNPGDGTLGVQADIPVGDGPRAVVLGDLDGDSDLDIVVVNHESDDVSVLLNIGGGEFAAPIQFSAESGPNDISLGDLDGDGDLDAVIITTTGFSTTGLLAVFNNGEGLFSDPARYLTGADPRSIALGDLDGNGYVDAVVTNQASDDVSVLKNNGNGTFAPQDRFAVGNALDSIELGDFDGDGDLDAAVGSTSPSSGLSILLNSGDGTLSFQTRYSLIRTSDLATGDFDQDGDLDIGVAYELSDALAILLNNGDGTFGDDPFFPGTLYPAGQKPSGVAVADLNYDGTPDVVVANAQSNDVSILFNDGHAAFASSSRYIGGSFLTSIADGDLDGDGFLDLVVTDLVGGAMSVFLNNRSGGFYQRAIYETGGLGTSTSIGDLDADGDLDIAIANSPSDDVNVLRNNGDGSFADGVLYAVGSSPLDVTAGDLDGDQDLDLIVINHGTGTASVLRNDSNGVFSVPTSYAVGTEPRSSALGDLDGDDDLDLVVTNSGGGDISVLFNNGDGTFTSDTRYSAGNAPWSASLCDLDGDGDVDVAVANQESDDLSVLINLGDGGFEPQTRYSVGDSPWGIVCGDLDEDGHLDVATANSATSDISVLLNNGDGSFAEQTTYAVGGGATFLTLGDFDGDNSIDIAVASSGLVSIFLNRRLSITHWTGGNSAFDSVDNWSGGIAPSITPPNVAAFDSTSGNKISCPVCRAMLTEETALGALAQANGDMTLDLAGFGLDIAGTRAGSTLVAFELGVPQCGDDTFPSTPPIFRFENTSGMVSNVTTPEAVIGVPGEATLVIADDVRFEVNGNILNRGVLKLDRQSSGAAYSIVTVADAYRQLDSQLIIDLGPDGAAPPLGRVQVGGPAILRGSLTVLTDPAFDPEIGDRFTLLTAGEPIGPVRFGAAFLPGMPGGKFFTVEYNTDPAAPGSVVLEVQSLGEDLGFGGSDQLNVSGIPIAAELADLNADGLPDVVLAVPDEVNPQVDAGSAIVLLNAGNNNAGVWQGFSSSQDIAVGVAPSDVALGDLDGDGFPDAIITNRADGNATVLLNDGTGLLAFDRTVGFNEDPAAVVAGDLDEDGLIDVAVAGSDRGGNGELIVRLNLGPNGGGGWGGLSAGLDFDIGQGPRFMDIGDLDNDSCLDLLIGSEGDEGVNLLDNLAGGQGPIDWQGFAPPLTITTGNDPFIGDIGDLDNDSCLDIIIADLVDGTLAIISHATPPGVFGFTPAATFPVGPAPRSIAVADFDNDFDADVAIVTNSDDGLGRVVRLLRNDIDVNDPDSQLQFAPTTVLDVQGDPVLVLAGDVDGTGSPDLVAITEAATGDAPAPEGDGDGPTGLVSPRLNLEDALFGCNAADTATPLGALDLADVVAFITAFGSGGPGGDLNNDGLLDLADLVVFVEAFAAGCP